MKLKITLFLLTLTFSGYSQSWQWGKRGGSTDNMSLLPEQVLSTTADDLGFPSIS